MFVYCIIETKSYLKRAVPNYVKVLWEIPDLGSIVGLQIYNGSNAHLSFDTRRDAY